MDIQVYLNEMEKGKAMMAEAIRVARRRIAMRQEMKAISDEAEDSEIAMNATQKTALVANQLALTEAVDAPLAAAKAALV